MFSWIHKQCPQNYIIRKPWAGAAVLAAFCFLFLMIYKPVITHPGLFLSYELTMAAYCLIAGLSVAAVSKLIRYIPYFSDHSEWTFLKEFLAVIMAILGMGIAGYFAAFIIEPPVDRWNLETFLDSCMNAFLIGIVPFAVFSLINARFWFPSEYVVLEKSKLPLMEEISDERPITLRSQLKKEHLEMYAEKLLYAESEGNYVVFYLEGEKQAVRKMLRNSMNNIEQQLADIPYIIRVHRAFMVNLKKVRIKQGNTLGYRLKLTGTDAVITVSRNNTARFNKFIRKFS